MRDRLRPLATLTALLLALGLAFPATAYDARQFFALVDGHRDCPRCDLRGADLKKRNLSGADLSRANLKWADLRDADLTGADLSAAHLMNADLAHAALAKADLKLANLMGADLSGASLSGAKLSTAWCDWRTQFPRFSLWTCKGVVVGVTPIWRAPIKFSVALRDSLVEAAQAVSRWSGICTRIVCPKERPQLSMR